MPDHLVKTRMTQAKESLAEAHAVLDGGMEPGLALNGLYYAFYYPVIALVYEGKVPTATQSVVIGLFDRQFIANGTFPKEFSDAIHGVFDLKPACGGEGAKVAPEEVLRLASLAREFIAAVDLYLQLRSVP